MTYTSRAIQAVSAYRAARTVVPLGVKAVKWLVKAPARQQAGSRFTGYVYPGRSLAGYRQAVAVPPLRMRSLRAPAPAGRRKKALVKRVRNLEKRARDEDSILTYKVSAKDTLRPSVNSAAYGFASCLSIANIEAAAATARFFDPAAPATLVTASLVAGTFASKFRVGAHCSITIKNNYQVPCYLTVGMVVPKAATSTTPNSARTGGLTDQGNPTESSPMLTWGDSKQFNETYRFSLKPRKFLLKPGGQKTFKHRQLPFLYDPAYFDTQTSTYQPRARSALWVYRCQGVPGHDTVVATEQGIMPAGIDVYAYDTYTIHYNSGGATLTTIVLSEGAATSFSTAGVVSQDLVDNQAYSVS